MEVLFRKTNLEAALPGKGDPKDADFVSLPKEREKVSGSAIALHSLLPHITLWISFLQPAVI